MGNDTRRRKKREKSRKENRKCSKNIRWERTEGERILERRNTKEEKKMNERKELQAENKKLRKIPKDSEKVKEEIEMKILEHGNTNSKGCDE